MAPSPRNVQTGRWQDKLANSVIFFISPANQSLQAQCTCRNCGKTPTIAGHAENSDERHEHALQKT